MHITFVLLFILAIILLLLAIGSYFIFHYIKNRFSGYHRLIKILKKIKGNYTNFMNFGYWKEDTTTLTEANQNLCDYIINKIDFKGRTNILDVGCGYGEQDFYIYSKIKKPITCLDIDMGQINTFKTKIKQNNAHEYLKAVVGDATKLCFDDHTFDTILNIESAFHYCPRVDFFKEAYRILQPNGKLLITDILINDRLPHFISYIPFKMTESFFNVPKANYIDKHEWKKQLEDVGFTVELYDITAHTFFPYFSYLLNNFAPDTFLIYMISRIVFNYSTSFNPFTYVVAIATKPSIPPNNQESQV